MQDCWFRSLYNFQSSCLSLPSVGISDLNFRPLSFTLEKPDLTGFYRILLSTFQNSKNKIKSDNRYLKRKINSKLSPNSFGVLQDSTELKSQIWFIHVNILLQTSRLSQPLISRFTGLFGMTVGLLVPGFTSCSGCAGNDNRLAAQATGNNSRRADTPAMSEGQ